jgi:Tfp pilus assembly protein FimT
MSHFAHCPAMSPPRANSQFHHQRKAYTLFEAMIYSSLIITFAIVGFRSMHAFTNERKLRAAAVELSSYLEIARNVALASNTQCAISIRDLAEGVFVPDASQANNSCNSTSIIPVYNLANLAGIHNLTVEVMAGSGAYPLIFNPEGTTRAGATVLISSSDVEAGSWCVDVQAPLGTVRRGWRARGANECNYALEP